MIFGTELRRSSQDRIEDDRDNLLRRPLVEEDLCEAMEAMDAKDSSPSETKDSSSLKCRDFEHIEDPEDETELRLERLPILILLLEEQDELKLERRGGALCLRAEFSSMAMAFGDWKKLKESSDSKISRSAAPTTKGLSHLGSS